MAIDDGLKERLLGVAAKIKAKGWESASIDVRVSYLGIFNREFEPPYDVMIHFGPSIRASTRDKYRHPTAHEFVKSGVPCETFADALNVLDATADAMPTHDEKVRLIEEARAKLSPEDRRLLGIN